MSNPSIEKCATCGKETHRGSLNGYGDCGPCATAKQNAKNYPKTFDISSGDRVSITLPNGQCYTGVVLTANHWDVHSGWYIELTHQNGYGYWKQGCDGGTVVKAAFVGTVRDFMKLVDGEVQS